MTRSPGRQRAAAPAAVDAARVQGALCAVSWMFRPRPAGTPIGRLPLALPDAERQPVELDRGAHPRRSAGDGEGERQGERLGDATDGQHAGRQVAADRPAWKPCATKVAWGSGWSRTSPGRAARRRGRRCRWTAEATSMVAATSEWARSFGSKWISASQRLKTPVNAAPLTCRGTPACEAGSRRSRRGRRRHGRDDAPSRMRRRRG